MRAPPNAVYAALQQTDFARLPIIRMLLELRALPFLLRNSSEPAPRRLQFGAGVHSFQAAGFGIVGEQPGREIVLGLSGPFWKPCPTVTPLSQQGAEEGPAPGTAHAGWSFEIVPLDDSTTRLSTETRVVTANASDRRRLLRYWFLVRPFSGLIRLLMLRAIRREAER